MTLTVKELIDVLTTCDPNAVVLITTDWVNKDFTKLTEVNPDCIYNSKSDEFETEIYNFKAMTKKELNKVREDPALSGYADCVVLS